MNAYIFALLVGLATLVVVIAIFLLIRKAYKKRGAKRNTFRQDFVRADMAADDSAGRAGGAQGKNGIRDSSQAKAKAPQRGRFYALAIAAAALFGTLAVKLWSLQVLSKDEYEADAEENMTQDVSIPAARGRVLDRNGKVLIGNRTSNVLKGQQSLASDNQLVHRLSLVSGLPKGMIRKNLLDSTQGSSADRIIAQDVPMRSIAYIKEHPTLFSGVTVDTATTRIYPYGAVGCHVLGYTGIVTQADLESVNSNSAIQYQSGDTIGKDGAELAFEDILQGVAGTRTYKVDSSGNIGAVLSEVAPTTGNDVCLTIDIDLQAHTDQILSDLIAKAKVTGHPNACAGALVCMDVTDSGILAASSFPTFDPSQLIGSISDATWSKLTSDSSNYPLTDRVIAGQYPAASTWKAFTSMAGLNNGVIGDGTTFDCEGIWTAYGAQWAQKCWIYPG
ncbi:MAG: hypothetical protein LBM21_00905, partial [Coriobacteriales bacterium]|nr:hypothetical protein [Coriobacteriales bacterium]